MPDELLLRGYQWNLAVPGYRRDKPVTGLAAAETPDGPLAAVASRATMIPVWSLASQEQVAELRLDGASAAMVLTFVSGRLFAGGTDGELLGWRRSAWWTARREPPAWATHPMNDDDYPGEHRPDIHIPHAHYGPVQAIAGGTWSGQPCVVTGGRDGRLHAWTVRGERLATADLGAAVTALVSAGPRRYAVGTERGLVLMESGTEYGLVPTESA